MAQERQKLTVLIPCKDEAENIRVCLESIQWADEILMADSGSTDETMAIGKEFNARIIEREYINSANMKNWAIPQATYDWVLVIDADERCSPELRDEILKTLEAPNNDGYRIRRRNFVLGREMKYGDISHDTVLRLFRKAVSKYEDKHVHADVNVETGNVGRLNGTFSHYTYRSLTSYFETFNRYTGWAAKDLLAQGKKPGLYNILFRPCFTFFRSYILRLGIFDGALGFFLSAFSAFYVLAKYAKLWSLSRAPDLKENSDREP